MTHLACYAYGAGHADEGVCLRLEIDNYRILLDCGLKNLHLLLQADDRYDFVLCSHAHPDHAYGLLALHQAEANLPIYASEVTTQLAPLNWLGEDVPPAICQPLPWQQPIAIVDRLTVELIPAGHLPGAAAFLIRYHPPTDPHPVQVFYTGDHFISNTRLCDGLRLETLRGLMPDVLILSGTYGTQRHPQRRRQENRLLERIVQAIEAGQSIVLPTSTIGLGQELLFLLRSQSRFSGRDLDIWVNGAVAAGCDAYSAILPTLPLAVQNFAQYQALFWDEKVAPLVHRGSPPTTAGHSTPPCIIISDTQTPIRQFCTHGEWLILLPEATAATAGWQIASATQTTQAEACITAETYWLSEHSDRNATCQLIHTLRPQHVLLVHGQPDDLADLATLEELSNRYKIHVPQAQQLVELPIAQHHGPPEQLPETHYEGEVAETTSEILIALPPEFAQDPRWQTFADTGVIEASWQGEQLVIRGMTAQELRQTRRQSPSSIESCLNCQFYQNQHCRNPDAPLFQLQVTAEGYCWAFESS